MEIELPLSLPHLQLNLPTPDQLLALVHDPSALLVILVVLFIVKAVGKAADVLIWLVLVLLVLSVIDIL